MFAEAIQNASRFTFPYVGLRLRENGAVNSIVASFVVMNSEGWIVTSAHVLEELIASGSMKRDDGNQPPKPDDLVDRSEIWAVPGFGETHPTLVTGRVNQAADIAIGRLEPFDADSIAEYPVLRDSSVDPIRQGESVCRLGFPFHDFPASYDSDARRFQLAPGSFPAPHFAMDGIVSRFTHRVSEQGSGVYIETSTAGLRGQSGGPLLDRAGRVIGVQSHTAHLDLGFDAPYLRDDGEATFERQFLNVGLATHVDEVVRVLEMEKVSFVLG